MQTFQDQVSSGMDAAEDKAEEKLRVKLQIGSSLLGGTVRGNARNARQGHPPEMSNRNKMRDIDEQKSLLVASPIFKAVRAAETGALSARTGKSVLRRIRK